MYKVTFKSGHIIETNSLCYEKNGELKGIVFNSGFYDIDQIESIEEITTTKIYPVEQAKPEETQQTNQREFEIGDKVHVVGYEEYFDPEGIYTIEKINPSPLVPSLSLVYFEVFDLCAPYLCLRPAD